MARQRWSRARVRQPVPPKDERTLLQDLALLLMALLALGFGWVMAALAVRVASW